VRVALKFCGGCDPGYERADYWRQIALAAGTSLKWRRLEDHDYQAVLLICGCATACPENEMPPGVPLVCLKDDRLAPAEVIRKLRDKE